MKCYAYSVLMYTAPHLEGRGYHGYHGSTKRRQSFFWSCTNARNVRDAEEDCGGGVLGKDLNTTAVGRGDRLAASCAALRLLEQDIHRINMTSSEGDKCASHEFD